MDHSHDVDKVKIELYRAENKGWWADATYKGKHLEVFGYSRDEAWKLTKITLFRMSIRGLICVRCNRGLALFEDSKAPLKPAERFDNAAKYFRDFEGSFNG